MFENIEVTNIFVHSIDATWVFRDGNVEYSGTFYAGQFSTNIASNVCVMTDDCVTYQSVSYDCIGDLYNAQNYSPKLIRLYKNENLNKQLTIYKLKYPDLINEIIEKLDIFTPPSVHSILIVTAYLSRLHNADLDLLKLTSALFNHYNYF